MSLQFEIANLADVEEAHRGLYVEKKDGGFRVDVTGLDETAEELRAQKAINRDARNAAIEKIVMLEKLALEPPPIAEPEPAPALAPRHPDDLRLEQETTAKIAAHVADREAYIAGLRSDRDTTALERTAVAIAAKLNPACVELLRPHVLERLAVSDAGGRFEITAKDLPTLDHLTEQFRADPRFARIIVGASPADQALHQKRVNETLGVVPAASTSMTRAAFEALSPAKRSEFARMGGKISDA